MGRARHLNDSAKMRNATRDALHRPVALPEKSRGKNKRSQPADARRQNRRLRELLGRVRRPGLEREREQPQTQTHWDSETLHDVTSTRCLFP